jgi:hypothetical protein
MFKPNKINKRPCRVARVMSLISLSTQICAVISGFFSRFLVVDPRIEEQI